MVMVKPNNDKNNSLHHRYMVKPNYANAKKAFYRSFNATFGRVGRSASEEVVMHLIKVKCLPVLLYGTDACPTNTTDLRSLEFTVKRIMIKLFCTCDNTVISSCMSFLIWFPFSDRVCHETLG